MNAAALGLIGLGALLIPSLGCTLVGFGIGSAVPRQHAELAPPQATSISPGTEVDVVMLAEPNGSQSPSEDVRVVHGTYRGLRRDRMIIDSTVHDDRTGRASISESEVPLSSIRTIKIGRSSYALEGTLVGLGLDVVAVVATVIFVTKLDEATHLP